MRRFALLLLCWLPLVASAAVYKWVDERGNVVYSDKPREGAKEINLPPPSVYSPPAAPAGAVPPSAEEKPAAAGYSNVAIVNPRKDETIWNNTGTLTVQVALEPGLNAAAGHRLALSLDGVQQPDQYTSNTLQLTNLTRGSHTVQVQVVDSEGTTLAASDLVTFHLKQASKLHRQQSGPAPRGAPAFPRQDNPPPVGGVPTPP